MASSRRQRFADRNESVVILLSVCGVVGASGWLGDLLGGLLR